MQAGRSKTYKPTARRAPEGYRRKLAKGGSATTNKYTDMTKTYQYKHFQETGKLDPNAPIPRNRMTDKPANNRPIYVNPRGNDVDFNKSYNGKPRPNNGGSIPSYGNNPRRVVKSGGLKPITPRSKANLPGGGRATLQGAAMTALKGGRGVTRRKKNYQ